MKGLQNAKPIHLLASLLTFPATHGRMTPRSSDMMNNTQYYGCWTESASWTVLFLGQALSPLLLTE